MSSPHNLCITPNQPHLLAKSLVAIASSFPSASESKMMAKSLTIPLRNDKKKPMHFALVPLTTVSLLQL